MQVFESGFSSVLPSSSVLPLESFTLNCLRSARRSASMEMKGKERVKSPLKESGTIRNYQELSTAGTATVALSYHLMGLKVKMVNPQNGWFPSHVLFLSIRAKNTHIDVLSSTVPLHLGHHLTGCLQWREQWAKFTAQQPPPPPARTMEEP